MRRVDSLEKTDAGRDWGQEEKGIIYLLVCLELMEKAMATHSSTLALKIPWMEEPGRLQSMGSQRVRQD